MATIETVFSVLEGNPGENAAWKNGLVAGITETGWPP